MNSLVIVRFGAVVLIAMVGLILLAEGAKTRRTYTFATKPRTKPREIRGLRPQSLSTAIGFGKRDSSVRSSDLKEYDSIMFSPQKDMQHQMFPLFWFLQYLKSNTDLPNEVERELLSEYYDYFDANDNVRPLVTHRYRKGSDTDDSYY